MNTAYVKHCMALHVESDLGDQGGQGRHERFSHISSYCFKNVILFCRLCGSLKLPIAKYFFYSRSITN